MFALLKRTRTGFFFAMIGLMLTSIITPVLAQEIETFDVGDDAVVNVDTRLYSEPALDADIEAEVAEDTPVSIEDGPFTAADGTIWYWVEVWDLKGFINVEDLDGIEADLPATDVPADDTTPTEETQPTEDEAPTLPWSEPIDFGVAYDNVTCRVDADTGASEITVVAAGQTIEITGGEVWVNGTSWTPVNCAGIGGFVATDFIGAEADQAATEEEVATEVVTEVATEEATAEETETAVATEEVAAEEPVVAQAVTEVATETLPAEAPAVDTSVAFPAGPWQQPISVSIANDFVTCRVDVSVTAPEITVVAAGETIEVTGAPVDVEGISWTPVNCAGVGGFVATQYIDAAVAETEVPAEAASAEATEVTTEASLEVTPADETAVATETTPVEGTEVATATPTATEEATEAPAEETTAATEEAPPEPTDVAEETPVVEEQLDSGQAVAETESAAPVEDSAIIGTGTVQGTNGTGLACRVGPDAASAVISVLPEGMNVFVLSQADANGWMSIVCNNEVGYVQSAYIYSGGAASDFSASGASYATVNSTGGTGLNCRSGPGLNYSVIGYFPAGSGVNVRGAAQGDWVPVVCGGSDGWVHGDYLTPADSSGTTGSTGGESIASTSSGTAVVTGTSGDGLRCRTAPNGSVITVMAEGTRVTVRGAAEGGWLPIVCASQNGYASAQYLSTEGGTTTPPPASSDGGVSSGTVTVTGTGSSLNCRSGAGTGYSIVATVRDGTVLNVRGAAENGWQPVVCNGINAWVSTMYITAGGTADGGGSDGGDTGTTPDAATGTATVVNTDGDSLRCRATPGGSTITMLAPGSTVSLRAEKSGDWQGVICAGQNGFAHSAYLSIGGGSTPAPTPTPTPPPSTSKFVNGDHAKTTDNLNLRYEPSSGAGVATYAPAGTVVLITGGHAGNGYYPVNWDGLKGYMHGDYMVKTSEALSQRGGSGDGGAGDGGGGSATGNAIVDYAMGYLGYPYVWATHGPSSFDCSGFTFWVVKNVVGIDIGYGLWTQVSAGPAVSRSNLQPGDLVFFQNTYKSGLSHVGIYIGDNQFIHAQNEATGVVISNLDSNYYGSRWYGAVRLT